MPRFYERPPPLFDVLEEYVEEAAFLYHARRRCFRDERLAWHQCAGWEARMEPHLHGLSLGGAHAAKILEPKLALDEKGDSGEAFTAAAVIPRLGLVAPMEALAEALAASVPQTRALLDGLRYSPPPSMASWIKDFSESEAPALRAAGVDLTGHLWPPGGAQLLSRAVRDEDQAVQLAASWALISRGIEFDLTPIEALLDHEDTTVSLVAIRLLLARGSEIALQRARTRLRREDIDTRGELALLLAVCGDLEDAAAIRSLSRETGGHDPQLILATGLSGDTASVPDILGELQETEYQDAFAAAWTALGALSGDHYPPPFDVDDGVPELVQVYQDRWLKWWDTAHNKMPIGRKYRVGRALSPATLVEDLNRPGNTRRDLSFLELQSRYHCSLPFDDEAKYDKQAAQLSALSVWVAR